eukprot:TRINITY_DN82722_c0_g1_i1.p1 TRINITY_DN82722_c0_g1~~TRINITY_DN82722_c0_g1_i1.p1  ORF type:complete len:620 (-),score=160.69 TRINITY_DN82722_c0_g1_i1:119-1978(-)
MSKTMIQKILSAHIADGPKDRVLERDDIIDVFIDVRAARDFGGANVVKNLQEQNLPIADPSRTFFTFDCNPTGSDQKYAANQHICRLFARKNGIKVYDIDQGIGTHVVVEKCHVLPGSTFVSTDSHANIMGSIGAFGQGMGDVDIAACFARGSIWFNMPGSLKLVLKGRPGPGTTAKDIALFMASKLGASGLLGYAAEVVGEYVDELSLSDRVTISSMGTEMGAIIVLFMPNARILEELGLPADFDLSGIAADPDAVYEKTIEIDISGMTTMVARPGHPDDGVPIETVKGTKIDSGFIGSCTNGKVEDMRAVAAILKDRKLAPGVVLKIVPATRKVWDICEDEGIIEIFMRAGALVGNAGCAGCAAGQIGQNGPGEVTVSTGNRNFPGKQGKGKVYLASPATVAASCVAGVITSEDSIPDHPVEFAPPEKPVPGSEGAAAGRPCVSCKDGPKTVFEGRVWVLDMDSVDTDMIYHNAHLQITDIKEMGQYALGNLEGWEDFPKKVQPGDMLVVGGNFGCGSSRQQAVDCFKSLGVSVIIGKSFGAIYERNAINAGFPIFSAPAMDIAKSFKTGDIVSVDLKEGKVRNMTQEIDITTRGFSSVQLSIYMRGGLLCADCHDW